LTGNNLSITCEGLMLQGLIKAYDSQIVSAPGKATVMFAFEDPDTEDEGGGPVSNTKSIKLAQQIATLIEREIIALGCPLGHQLGTEAELAARYGVSRWVMREACALTERDGLAQMRRGRHGGLVVTGTPERALSAAICYFLLFASPDISELISVRKVVERVVYVLAATQPDDTELASARALLQRNVLGYSGATEIYAQILRFANNAFVGVFGMVLSELTGCLIALHELPGIQYGETSAVGERLLQIRRWQLECIVGADPSGTIEAAAAAAVAWRDLFAEENRQHPPTSAIAQDARADLIARRVSELLHPGRAVKASSLVATRMMIHILNNQLQPGDPIAPEPELMTQYRIGRPVLREAIRILERNGLVRSEVGRSGGLRVGKPDITSLVDRTVAYFQLLNVTPAQFEVLRSELAILTAELVARKVNAEGSPLVEKLVRNERLGAEAASRNSTLWLCELHAALAELTGNPVLALFFGITNRMIEQLKPRLLEFDGAIVNRLHSALATGDFLLTRRAMAHIVTILSLSKPQTGPGTLSQSYRPTATSRGGEAQAD
jgi:DNA-binding FadR family transcriptional regulator